MKFSQIKTNCSYCDKEISLKKSQFERANLHFCNVECKHNYNRQNGFWGKQPHNYQGDKEVICVNCGKDFTVSSGQYNDSIKFRKGNFCCSRKCVGAWNKQNSSGENSARFGVEGLSGELNPAWKGGITPFIKAVRLCGEYYRWKTKCLERDKYKCSVCESNTNLEVHHKKRLTDIINYHNIKNMKEAKMNKELWDTSNGQVLCKECHDNITWNNEVSE